MTKFRILHSYDDGSDLIVLGHVATNLSKKPATKLLESFWAKFQKTRPDTDGNFLAYILENSSYFTKVEVEEFNDVVV